MGTLGPNIWLCNLNVADSIFVTKNICSNFWQEVVKMWCEYRFTIPSGNEEIKDQFLWYNSHIRRNNKPYIIKLLYEKNIYI